MSHAVVLCEGFDGHVAIEMANTRCPSANSQEDRSLSQKDVHSSCRDTLISSGAHYNIQKQSDRVKLIRSLSFVVPPLFAPPRVLTSATVRFFNQSQIVDHTALASLRAVVLLI